MEDISPNNITIISAKLKIQVPDTSSEMMQQIAGASVGSDAFVKGEGDAVCAMSSDGLYVGSATFANAPFRVTMAGDVTATSINITGSTLSYGKTSFTDSVNAGYYLSSAGWYVGSAADANYIKYTLGTGAFVVSGALTTNTGSSINGTYITSASITGSAIASATITATNIANATITATQIANATITTTQISGTAGITGSQIASATIAGGNIASATITATNIANATITTTQISGTAGITGSQIASATIAGGNIASATITATNIANATITTTQISGTAGITGSQIASATIMTGNIGSATITASNIANATITTTQISGTAGITGSQIASNTIGAGNITNATITATQIANGAITPVLTTIPVFVLSAGAFTNNSPIAGKVAWANCKVVYNGTQSTITNDNTASTYVVWDSASPTIFSGSATVPTTNTVFLVGINSAGTYATVWDMAQVNGAQIQANTITAGQIVNATITGTQIALATITASNITNATITATEIANGTITTTQIANATIIATNISATAAITGSQLSTTAGIVGGQIANTTITGGNIVNNTVTIGKCSIPTHFITATWTDDTPDTDSVTWASAKVDYNGTTYSITNGNTNKKYIWWDFSLSTTTFQTTDTLPTLADGDVLVAYNNAGVHRLLWNATDVDGSQIQLAAITGALIANTTITGGNLVNNTITATQIANATITGTQIAAVTIAGSNIINNTITAGKVSLPTHFVIGTFTNDSPVEDSVAWTGVTLDYNGATYSITAGNTANKYIWWDYSLSTTTFQTSVTLPTLANEDCLVGLNNSGVYQSIWNSTGVNGGIIENATIVGGSIANTTITGANLVNNTITATQIANTTITTTQMSATAGVTAGQLSNLLHFVEGTFVDNDPSAGKVSWTNAKVYYGNTTYAIDNGNTSDKFIYWDYSNANTTFKTSATLPTLANEDCLIALNTSGVHTILWNATGTNGATITANSINATEIANAAITTTQISGTAGITGGQIAATTITYANIANNTISATQIANATITTTQISGTAGITGGQIATTTIAAGNIVNNTITATQIVNNTITATQIANNTITATQIANATITATQITALTITAAEIANLTITDGKIGDVGVGKLTTGTIASKQITLGLSGTTDDCYINSGKTDYTNTDSGFILGLDNSDDDKAKFYIGNTTDYFNFNGVNTIIKTTLADAITVDYGSDILFQEGGSINFTTVTAPTDCTATLVATDTGNIDNGTHSYKVTFINDTGETDLGEISNTITVDDTHKQVNLSNIPTSISGAVTSRKIYRTKAGAFIYYLLTTINNNSGTTYTDNTSDANLGTDEYNNKENTTFGKITVDGDVILSCGLQNTFVGKYAGGTIGYANYSNVGVGTSALNVVTTGSFNNSFGSVSLAANTTGRDNCSFGTDNMITNVSGSYNSGFGNYSLEQSTGDNNTALGYSAGRITTGNGNVFLGYFAGYYESGSNALYIDNQNRSNSTGDKTKALLYGVFATTAANQKLTINGLLNQSVSKTPASAAAAGTTGDICWDASYVYVCTATDTWKRVGIATW